MLGQEADLVGQVVGAVERPKRQDLLTLELEALAEGQPVEMALEYLANLANLAALAPVDPVVEALEVEPLVEVGLLLGLELLQLLVRLVRRLLLVLLGPLVQLELLPELGHPAELELLPPVAPQPLALLQPAGRSWWWVIEIAPLN